MQRSNFEKKNDHMFQIITPMCRGAESRQPTIKPHQNAHFPLRLNYFSSRLKILSPPISSRFPLSSTANCPRTPLPVLCRAVFVMRVIDYGNLERPREMVRDGEQNLRPAVSDEPLVA